MFIQFVSQSFLRNHLWLPILLYLGFLDPFKCILRNGAKFVFPNLKRYLKDERFFCNE